MLHIKCVPAIKQVKFIKVPLIMILKFSDETKLPIKAKTFEEIMMELKQANNASKAMFSMISRVRIFECNHLNF